MFQQYWIITHDTNININCSIYFWTPDCQVKNYTYSILSSFTVYSHGKIHYIYVKRG
jgi:hypothetical protein